MSATRKRAPLRTFAFHAIAITTTAAYLAPLLVSFVNALRPASNATAEGLFAGPFSLDNYRLLATYGEGIGVYLKNSLAISAMTVAFTCTACVLAGYGFARFRFRGSNAIFAITLGILMVPYASLIIPLYTVLGWLHLQNTQVGVALVLSMLQLPFGVFVMRNSFNSIPPQLEEAAFVDGASSWRAFRSIALPLAGPGVATVALFSFIASWNEFLAPLIFLNRGDQYTIPIMLSNIAANAYGVVDYGALQAGIVISVVPTLMVYLPLQRYYVAGLVNGALSG